MKAAAYALAAGSLVSSAIASSHDRHMNFHNKRGEEASCSTYTPKCTTYTTWVTVPISSSPAPSSSPSAYASVPVTVPTPYVTSFSSTGTYTVPGSTITLTSTATVPSPTSTVCEGTCTYGGVTTSVTTETVVTCPYATTSVTGGVTSTIVTSTTYSCPSGGEYTIVPPTTVTVPSTSTIVYPTATSYPPGTYTAPTTTVTVTKTHDVYTCPFESVTPTEVPAPAPTTVYTSPEAPTTTEAPTSVYSPPESTPSPKPHHHQPKPKPKPVHNGNQWAMTYTPYAENGDCKSVGQIKSDIASIHSMGFTTVRTYSTDCDTLPAVGSACSANGMRMILGIFIDESGISGAEEQVSDIMSWGQYDLVDMVVVGNEAIFNGYVTASELAGYIDQVRSKLEGAGCNAQFTTTEPVDILQEYGASLCGHMDVVAANIQPYFDANTSPADAGEFVVSQLGLTKEVCPDLEAYNLECGWPHSGGANGAAITGVSQQAQAISSIVAKAGKNTAIFSFDDDMWKSPGYNGVEQYFGAASCF